MDNISNRVHKYYSKLINHKSFQNFLIIGGIAVIQLSNNVILGRSLTKEDFGIYSFIFFNVIRLMSFVFLFGQNNTIIRYFSGKDIGVIAWKQYLFLFILWIVGPIFVVSYGIVSFYQLNFDFYFIICFGSLMMCSSNLVASFYRAREKFNVAILIQRANPLLFFCY